MPCQEYTVKTEFTVLCGRVNIYSGSNQEVLYRFNGTFGDGVGPGRRAGDVNNDGYADIIVGFYTNSSSQSGKAVVYSGKDGSELQSIVHSLANAQFGFDAIGIGDVNGDNMDNFLVSASNNSKVYVIAGSTEKLPDSKPLISINSGLSGTWYNSQTPGQGFVFDINTTIDLFFGAWFSYKPESFSQALSKQIGSQEHLWLSVQGGINDRQADLNVYSVSGGVFNDPKEVILNEIGTVSFSFFDCSQGHVNYTIVLDGQIITNEFDISRITPDSFCQSELIASPSKSQLEAVSLKQVEKSSSSQLRAQTGSFLGNNGLTGAWYNPDTGGQGILIDFSDDIDLLFAAWFTFDTEVGGGQRWLTLQGSLGKFNSIQVPIYNTKNGVFDSNQATTTEAVGLATFNFISCNEAQMNYQLNHLQEHSGLIDLVRLTPDVYCHELLNP